MNRIAHTLLPPLTLATHRRAAAAGDNQARLAELDAYWAEVSRAVNTGDFEAYSATCHHEGILVSGNKKTSQPLAEALARWKQDFVEHQGGQGEGQRRVPVFPTPRRPHHRP